jgi:electron transport complex protein RnfC
LAAVAEQQAAQAEAPAADPVDPRKAAVEAAIARAKARKSLTACCVALRA